MFEKPNEANEPKIEDQKNDSLPIEEKEEPAVEDRTADSTEAKETKEPISEDRNTDSVFAVDDGFSEDLKNNGSKQPKKRKKVKLSKTQRTVIVVISCVLAALVLVSGSMYLFPAFFFTNATAMTVNGMKVPVYEYNFNYWTTVQYFYQSYGNYIDPSTFDITKDLSMQQCPSSFAGDKVITWQDYFLDLTDTNVEAIIIAYQKALEQGFGLTDTDQSAINNYFDVTIKNNAASRKLSEEDFIRGMFGSSCNKSNIRIALEHALIAQHYSEYLYNSYNVEQTELDSWMTQYKDQFWGACYNYYGFPAASDKDTDVAAAKEKAHDFLSKVTDQASFVSLAYKTAADADKAEYESATATLKYYLTSEEIADSDVSNWLFDASRKPGDKEVVYSVTNKTAYVLYFVDANYPPTLAANLYSIYLGVGDKYADANAAQAAAQAVQAKFIEGGKTADVFKQLAAQYSEDANVAKNSGFNANFVPKNMDSAVEEWCYSPDRKLGEYTIVASSDGGYYFVYLDSWGDPVWRVTAIADIQNYHYMQTQDQTFSSVKSDTTFFRTFMVKK